MRAGQATFGAAVLCGAALLGTEFRAEGQDAENPALFEASDVNVFEVKDFTTTLSAGRRRRQCTTYYGRRQCYDTFEPFGAADVTVGFAGNRGRFFDVDALEVAASAYGGGGYGATDRAKRPRTDESATDRLAAGTRPRATFDLQRRRIRTDYGFQTTDVARFGLGTRLAKGTRLKLRASGSSYGGADYLSVDAKTSHLRGGITPSNFSRSVYDDRTGTTREIPQNKVSLSGVLPIRGGQALRFSAVWTSATAGTVTFESPSHLAGTAGTIARNAAGDFDVRGPKGSGIRIVVDGADRSAKVNLGYGAFRVEEGAFLFDGEIAAGGGEPGADGCNDLPAIFQFFTGSGTSSPLGPGESFDAPFGGAASPSRVFIGRPAAGNFEFTLVAVWCPDPPATSRGVGFLVSSDVTVGTYTFDGVPPYDIEVLSVSPYGFAATGSVEITRADSRLQGTLDVTFPFGDRLVGTFDLASDRNGGL